MVVEIAKRLAKCVGKALYSHSASLNFGVSYM